MSDIDMSEYIEKSAQLAALKAVNAFKDSLPCKEHVEMMQEHDNILKNGLKDSVDRLEMTTNNLDKRLQKHEKAHAEQVLDRRRGKKAFWRAFALGTIGPGLIGVLLFSLKLIFGGLNAKITPKIDT